jgi:Glycosyl hydrolase family 57
MKTNNSIDKPVISGDYSKIKKAVSKREAFYSGLTNSDFNNIKSSFGIVLHMHQPTIPASCDDLKNAELISNLQHMMEHQNIGDNHNAPVFLHCYERIADFIRELVDNGNNPRIMLDYSGNLLWGLQQIQNGKVIESLKLITQDKKYYPYVEWVGTMFSHAVVTSTPVPDIKLHIQAWQFHFASIFGYEALGRVKGFSPPEMHLPIHPDVCYEYIKALKECGYEWILLQEHTVERLGGGSIERPHFPHKLVAKNSLGDIEEIIALIKTQGSDTKLVAQMQPFYEAEGLNVQDYAGKSIPPFVAQISDGENGGVMMNEFPSKYMEVFSFIKRDGTVSLNGSEYLEFIKRQGVKTSDFTKIQPVSQARIWDNFSRVGVGSADRAIAKVHESDQGFNLERASWTNDKDWVKGYDDVLDPMNKLSAAFHAKYDKNKKSLNDPRYAEALLYLLLSQTSCFRYWGQGAWTDYAREICDRGMQAL